jgi:hypothetical protein
MTETNKERNKKDNLNFVSHAKKCLTYFLKKKKFFLPQVQFGQNNFIETEQKRLKQTIHCFFPYNLRCSRFGWLLLSFS